MFTLFRVDGLVISDRMVGAFSFLHRARGLLGKRKLSGSHALWFRPGGSVHTFGMRFPIDVLFLDENLTVLALAEEVKPWRVKCAPSDTCSTVEFAAGRIAQMGVQKDDELFIQPRGSSNANH